VLVYVFRAAGVSVLSGGASRKNDMSISRDSKAWIASILQSCVLNSPVKECRLLTLGRQSVEGFGLNSEAWFAEQGFSGVDSLDVSEHEGATYVCDLNQDIPPNLRGRYDVVYDGGTMEHVFDVRMFLSNCGSLVSGGGFVIHSVPVNNFVNHGFWQISPTALLSFYRLNGFVARGIGFYHSVKGENREGGLFWSESDQDILRLLLASRIVFPETYNSRYLITMTVVVQKHRDVDRFLTPTQPFYSAEFSGESFGGLKGLVSFVDNR
jgi:hypothetical protein